MSRLTDIFLDFIKRHPLWFNLTAVVTITISMVWVLRYDPYSLFELNTDFNSTDFYDNIAYKSQQLPISTDIVIFASDDIPTSEFPEVLRRLRTFAPAGVGLDILFVNKESVSTALIDALDSIPGLVLPVSIDYGDSMAVGNDVYVQAGSSLLDNVLAHKEFGHTGFPRAGSFGLNREFLPSVTLSDSRKIPGISAALAKNYRPETVADLTDGSPMRINFKVSKFEEIGYDYFMDESNDDMLDNLIRGRIVLIGDCKSPYDVHQTPIDHKLPGVYLHAHSLATILSGRHIHTLPHWAIVMWGLAFVVLTCLIYIMRPDADIKRNLMLNGVKFIFILSAIIGGYLIYILTDWTADFSYSITIMLFGLLICDLWFTIFQAKPRCGSEDCRQPDIQVATASGIDESAETESSYTESDNPNQENDDTTKEYNNPTYESE